jgi:hypothetical protein
MLPLYVINKLSVGLHIDRIQNDDQLFIAVKTEVLQGRGWKVGEVKETLSGLVQKYSQVPKKAAYTYTGPNIGESPVWYWRGVMDYVIDSIFGI